MRHLALDIDHLVLSVPPNRAAAAEKLVAEALSLVGQRLAGLDPRARDRLASASIGAIEVGASTADLLGPGGAERLAALLFDRLIAQEPR